MDLPYAGRVGSFFVGFCPSGSFFEISSAFARTGRMGMVDRCIADGMLPLLRTYARPETLRGSAALPTGFWAYSFFLPSSS